MQLDAPMEQIHVAENYMHYDSQILVADALPGVGLQIGQMQYRHNKLGALQNCPDMVKDLSLIHI